MTGAPVGLDHIACAQMSEALGYDTNTVLRLLPFAELGMVRGINKKRQQESS